MKSLMLIALTVAFAGCATSAQPRYSKLGGSPAQFDTDKRECEYEALKAVQSYDPGMKSIFGQELDLALRRNEVTKQCLMVRGYRSG